MIYFKEIKLQQKGARPAWTYRGARRNADRQETPAAAAKAERLALGITRRQFDRLRWQAAYGNWGEAE